MFDIDAAAKTFIAALRQAEGSRSVETLLPLFAPNAEVGSISLRRPLTGRDGVRKFWTDYLAVFRDVRTEVTHVHAAGHLATLEWLSGGTLPDGRAISYKGVTILEFEDGKIARFRTYYDSAAFIPDCEKLLGREMGP